MQCFAYIRATYRKQQTPQLQMDGAREGCGLLFSEVILTILSPIVGTFPSDSTPQNFANI